MVIAIVGAVTAFYAATVALRQHDLKRVLAYSTISQLGYMFVAMGAVAPAAGIFHLVTHAFFKALLFLAAGSVMHAMHDVIDMRRLGGLARPLRWTAGGFIIGSLALAGIPPFAGFFSKDLVLEQAFALGMNTWQLHPLRPGPADRLRHRRLHHACRDPHLFRAGGRARRASARVSARHAVADGPASRSFRLVVDCSARARSASRCCVSSAR